MKKMKYLRSWLTIALVVTIIGSLTGGTVAWFTDTVESTDNVIQSGNLDMVVEYWTADGQWAELKKDTKLFKQNALYEPGYTETVFLRISNAGNLAFKYKAKLAIEDSVIGKSVLGNDIKLSDYLEVGTLQQIEYNFGINMWEAMKEATFNTREKAIAAVSTPNNASVSGLIPLKNMAEDGTLEITSETAILPGENTANVMAIVLTMPTTVENEANHLTGTAAPQINLGLHVVATQYMHEEDSFGNDYDKDATYPGVGNDAPKASVTALSGSDLTVTCTTQIGDYEVEDFFSTFPLLEGEQTLNFGLAFTTTETSEDIADSEYKDWIVDFEIESTKALSKDDTESRIALVGYYPFLDLAETKEWIGFEIIGVDVAANDPQRVVAIYDAAVTYAQVVETVGEFKCGVIVDEEYFDGETLTLKLCMYNPDDPDDVRDLKTITKTF